MEAGWSPLVYPIFLSHIFLSFFGHVQTSPSRNSVTIHFFLDRVTTYAIFYIGMTRVIQFNDLRPAEKRATLDQEHAASCTYLHQVAPTCRKKNARKLQTLSADPRSPFHPAIMSYYDQL